MEKRKTSVIDIVKEDLIDQIVSGDLAVGEAVLSERKLAEKHQVSYMTARKAVFELVEEGYLRKESTRGAFVSNRWGAKNDLRHVAKPVIMLILSDLCTELSAKTVGHIERIGRDQNFQLMVCNSELNVKLEAMHLEQALLLNVAGVIISPCYPQINEKAIRKLLEKGLPVVQIDKYFNGLEAMSVACDNYDAAFAATEYLIALGHRRIAHITSNDTMRNVSSVSERFAGYRDALRKNKLEFRPEYVPELTRNCVHTTMADLKLQSLGYREMSTLLKLATPPTAVFLLFDELAVGAIHAITDNGLAVPGDISLIGVNNSEIASYLEPPLTTMAQPIQELAVNAVGLIVDHLAGRRRDELKVKLKTKLIVRESCRSYEQK